MTSGGARSRLHFVAIALALLALAAALVAPIAGARAADGPPPPSADREVLRAVHTDMLHVTYENGQLGLDTREGLGDFRYLDPAGVIFNLEDVPAAQFLVPDDPAFAFLGPAGQPGWLAPETQAPEIIWPGWDTENLSTGTFEGDAVDLTLLNVEGPGNVEVFFNYDPFTNSVPRVFSSVDESIRTHHQPVHSHVHANWAFSALGTYTLTFEASARTVDGTAVRTGPVDYTFVVGPYTPAPADITTSLTVAPDVGNAGEEVTLTATVEPTSATGWVEFLDGTETLGHEPVADGQAVVTTTVLRSGTHTLTARFTPTYNDDWRTSTSTPVEYVVEGTDPSPSPTPTTSPTPTPSPTPTNTPTTSPTPTPSPTPTTEPCEGIDTVLADGHVDIAARMVNSALEISVKDGTRGPSDVVWRPLDKTAFHVRPEGKIAVPEGEAFAFLGAPGDPVWRLPQTQLEGLLWPGWSTEAIDYTQLEGPVRWSLEEVEGPGKYALYTIDEFGQPVVLYDTGETLPQHVDLTAPTHAHGNWAFTEEGIYRLRFAYTATTKSGTTLTDTATLPVAVGDVDLAELCPGDDVPSPSPSPTNTATETPTPSPTPTETATATPTPDPTTENSNDSSPESKRECVATAPTPTPTPTSTQSPAPGGDATVLDDGHVDYGVRLLNGNLTSQIKDGTVAGETTWRDPADVVFHLKPAAATEVPTGSGFAFLGASGATIWQIPQTQKAGILWLGWNTEEVTTAQINGDVTWRLDKVEGPGKLAVFEFDSFGQPKVIFDSGDGVPDTFGVPLGTHAHGNWAFTKEGVYELTFTHSAKVAGTTSSDTAVVRFAVGDVDVPTSTTTTSTTSTSSTQQTAARTSNGCALAKTGGEASTPFTTASVLLGAGALLTAGAAYRRRKRNP